MFYVCVYSHITDLSFFGIGLLDYFSEFQLYNVVLLAIVTKLYLRAQFCFYYWTSIFCITSALAATTISIFSLCKFGCLRLESMFSY